LNIWFFKTTITKLPNSWWHHPDFYY